MDLVVHVDPEVLVHLAALGNLMVPGIPERLLGLEVLGMLHL